MKISEISSLNMLQSYLIVEAYRNCFLPLSELTKSAGNIEEMKKLGFRKIREDKETGTITLSNITQVPNILSRHKVATSGIGVIDLDKKGFNLVVNDKDFELVRFEYQDGERGITAGTDTMDGENFDFGGRVEEKGKFTITSQDIVKNGQEQQALDFLRKIEESTNDLVIKQAYSKVKLL